MEFNRVKTVVIETLKQELNPALYYHNHVHTLDVISASEHLGMLESIGGEEMMLLLTASLLHDTGYMWAYDQNEQLACNFARKLLPEYNYSNVAIDRICEMIMATQLPQSPKDLLAKILCDADLDYFGRDDFFPIAIRLHQEWKEYTSKHLDFLEWYSTQFEFMIQHTYFTDVAKQLRNKRKEENLNQIRRLLVIVDDLGNTEIAARGINQNPSS